eukprot:scaffold110307_cov27-Prasinocladus_malaysianus.AAC.1
MSKSAESEMSRIHLLDDPDVIANKIKRAKTDTFDGFEFDNPERPECKNLLSMYQIMTGKSQVPDALMNLCHEMGCGFYHMLHVC